MKKSFLLLGISLVAALASCEKSSDTTLPLAVDATQINLKATAGSTKFNIWSTDQWSVKFRKPVDWASLDMLRGKGNQAVQLSYSANVDIVRQVELIITTSTEQSDTVKFIQAGAFNPSMSFTGAKTVEAKDETVVFDFVTNLGNHLDEIETEVNYLKYLYDDEDDEDVTEPEGGWVKNVSLSADSMTLSIAPNSDSRPRRAEIKLSFTSVLGAVTTTTARITQMNP